MRQLKKVIWSALLTVSLLGLCSFASAAQKPDLTIVQMKAEPDLSRRVAGGMVTLTAMVFNKGNAAAPPSKAVIKISTTTSPPFYIGALEPNKGKAIYFNIHLNNPATYTAVFEADTENAVNESNETNNEVPFVFEVRPVNPPDLFIRKIEINPANPTTNDMIQIFAEVANSGDEKTPEFNSTIRVGGESTPLVIGPIYIYGPNSTVIRRGVKLEAGNFIVTSRADTGNTVAESNESNNEGSFSFTVKAAKPDLTIRQMKITPANPTTQDTITFSAVVVNIGTLIAPAGKAGIRVGGETTPTLYNFLYVDNRPYMLSRQLRLDRKGNYKVVFIADVEKKIDELDETNNEGSLSFTVR